MEQSANAARNAQKAKYQGMLSLYLNVIYQIIKNMVYPFFLIEGMIPSKRAFHKRRTALLWKSLLPAP